MTIDQHSGFSPEAHIQEVDGEIVPYVEPIDPPDYLANLPAPKAVDPEVLQAMAEADAEAAKFTAKGYRPERVKELAGRGRRLAMLAVRGHDVKSFLPDEDAEAKQPSGDSDSALTPAQERRAEVLTETMGLSYADAVGQVKK